MGHDVDHASGLRDHQLFPGRRRTVPRGRTAIGDGTDAVLRTGHVGHHDNNSVLEDKHPFVRGNGAVVGADGRILALWSAVFPSSTTGHLEQVRPEEAHPTPTRNGCDRGAVDHGGRVRHSSVIQGHSVA